MHHPSLNTGYLNLQPCLNGPTHGSYTVHGPTHTHTHTQHTVLDSTGNTEMPCTTMSPLVSMVGCFLLMVVQRSQRVPQQYCALMALLGCLNAEVLQGHRFRMGEDVKAWAVFCRRDQLREDSMGWLPQQKLRLFLMASTPLPATIPKQVSFGQHSCHIFQVTNHVPLPWTILHKIWVSYSLLVHL
jgi:hypothetical protein